MHALQFGWYRPRTTQNAQGGCQDFQINPLVRREVFVISSYQVQLSWLYTSRNRAVKLYRSQKDQLQSLSVWGHLNGSFESLPEETAPKEISRTQQIRQSLFDDWGGRHHKIRHHSERGLSKKDLKRRLALRQTFNLKLRGLFCWFYIKFRLKKSLKFDYFIH